MAYISSIDRKRDYSNTIAYAEKKGLQKGLEKGRLEERIKAEAERKAEDLARAKKMLASGFEIAVIADILDLPKEEIEKLK